MSRKTVDLLLLENVESLGIVGDVVSVKTGYARNFLLPRGFATAPSEALMGELAEKRRKAQEEMAALRADREKMVSAVSGITLRLERACNDQGQLYGSVTQQDVAAMIAAMGHPVRDRDVRLGQVIKRVGAYDITVKPEQDLETAVHIVVEPEGGIVLDEEAGEDVDESVADEAGTMAEAEADAGGGASGDGGEPSGDAAASEEAQAASS